MSGRANPESEYVLYGHLHISHFCFASLALSCACALISVAFLPGYFKAIGVIVPILLHGVLGFAVHKRHLTGLYASFGLIVTLYIIGLLSMLIFIGIEVVQNRRGSFKLYILHAATLSGLWTNVLLLLIYGLNKLIYIQRNNYSSFTNEP